MITAKAKGLSENRVLYGHVFRNAMLIVIAGFPSVFFGVFFGGSIIIETIFSLDGLGRLGFEAAVAARLPGDLRHALLLRSRSGLVVGILSDLMYVFVDPRIDFDTPGDLSHGRCRTAPRARQAAGTCATELPPDAQEGMVHGFPRSTSAAGGTSSGTAGRSGRSGSSRSFSACR